MRLTVHFSSVMIIIMGFQIPLLAMEWPQWRGPTRYGMWREEGIVKRFTDEQLPAKWRATISNGYSGPTVAHERVYVTDRITTPVQAERVHCLDAMTGVKIWSHTYECKYEQIAHRNGPRAAVALNDGRAYSLGAMGHLFCFDATSGLILWYYSLTDMYECLIEVGTGNVGFNIHAVQPHFGSSSHAEKKCIHTHRIAGCYCDHCHLDLNYHSGSADGKEKRCFSRLLG